jgi:hypothetical protein
MDVAAAQLDEGEVVVEVEVAVDDDVGEPPDPEMAISAQPRYTCAVWNEFHLKRRSVCAES